MKYVINQKKLLEVMAKQKINPAALARASNVSRRTVYSIIHDTNQPKPATIGKIAEALNVEISEIADFK